MARYFSGETLARIFVCVGVSTAYRLDVVRRVGVFGFFNLSGGFGELGELV